MAKVKRIDCLKDTDIYSLAMFILYKIKDVTEYSVIGELPYILDKTNLLNLCTYFGGQTIKIPTLSELYSIIYIVLLYQYVNIDGIKYDEAIKLIGFKQSELRQVKTIYLKLSKVLNAYNFRRLDND